MVNGMALRSRRRCWWRDRRCVRIRRTDSRARRSVVTGAWRCQVREPRQKRHVVLIDAVAKQVVRRDVECRRERSRSREDAQFDVNHVITNTPPIREARKVAAEETEPVCRSRRARRASGWRNGEVKSHPLVRHN